MKTDHERINEDFERRFRKYLAERKAARERLADQASKEPHHKRAVQRKQPSK
jgi:hypothetical protein